MHKIIVVGLGILLMSAPCNLFAVATDSLYKLDFPKIDQASYARVTLTESGGKLIEVKLPEDGPAGDEPPAHLEDFNFDGYPDLAVFRNAGNVQIFYDVYLSIPHDKNSFLIRS